jgi:hypothetical protein
VSESFERALHAVEARQDALLESGCEQRIGTGC